ncbi:hypothetical protein SAMN04488012_10281 [Palleronia salina]|uniref:Holin-X, holin superfamily III n=1 Tax=Palleronia salina TaxID=313368 RepID=A0A1M6CL51_9RHOB|nr:hypothetical protein [Palleronia salina]SHI61689.1 hypothetical protein SAMN04488012_10281 [Palleronia salina]
MFAPILLRAQLMGKRVARRAVYGTLGGLFALVGVGFFASAGMIYLIDLYGGLIASLIVGGVFFVIGLLILAYSKIPPRAIPREQARQMADPTKSTEAATDETSARALTAANVAQAFLLGLSVARAISRKD